MADKDRTQPPQFVTEVSKKQVASFEALDLLEELLATEDLNPAYVDLLPSTKVLIAKAKKILNQMEN